MPRTKPVNCIKGTNRRVATPSPSREAGGRPLSDELRPAMSCQRLHEHLFTAGTDSKKRNYSVSSPIRSLFFSCCASYSQRVRRRPVGGGLDEEVSRLELTPLASPQHKPLDKAYESTPRGDYARPNARLDPPHDAAEVGNPGGTTHYPPVLPGDFERVGVAVEFRHPRGEGRQGSPASRCRPHLRRQLVPTLVSCAFEARATSM